MWGGAVLFIKTSVLRGEFFPFRRFWSQGIKLQMRTPNFLLRKIFQKLRFARTGKGTEACIQGGESSLLLFCTVFYGQPYVV